MQLCLRTFLSDPAETDDKAPSFMDMEFLFGKLRDVVEVSGRLLRKLQPIGSESSPLSCRDTGLAFKALADDLEKAYLPYCADLAKIKEKIDEYRKEPEATDYFERRIKQMGRTVNIPDVQSALDKPVQRIVKYHLFLESLEKDSEDIQDKRVMVEARYAMTKVCENINERKREQERVSFYKNSEDNTNSLMRMASQTWKKMNLWKNVLEDDNFQQCTALYQNAEKTLEVFLFNVGLYIEGLTKVKCRQNQLAERIAQFYEGQLSEEARRFYIVYQNITSRYTKLAESVEICVKAPLQKVQAQLKAPNKLISERNSKLLAYAQLKKQQTDECRTAADGPVKSAENSFEALNKPLLRELPLLRRCIKDMIHHCLAAFAKAQQKFIEGCLEEFCNLQEFALPALLASDSDTLASESFNVRPADRTLDQIARLSFTPDEWITSFGSPLGPTSVMQARSTAQLKGMATATRDQARSVLDTADQRSGATGSGDQVSVQETDLQSCDEAAMLQAVVSRPHPIVTTPEMCTPLCPFQARNSQELTLALGDVVVVIRHFDAVQNPEWWLVRNTSAGNRTGYVPANYLRKI